MLKMVGVETFYGKVKALHGVSLDVKEGQLVLYLARMALVNQLY
ncbi:MAG: hypothetical protein CM1200mP10_08340 [Candidatus Neomarinimicrobiota bacterium]|nr:MAG: hypothetical protein CM1200mP10_08340 [Candidatus Neomarinimicrobiota bacterium]